MFSFIGMAFIGYAYNKKKYMLTGFACAAALCVFLKDASNSNLKLPDENNNIKLSVAHVNVSSAETSYEAFVNELEKRNLDIISIQEVKPDWSRYLKKHLSKSFPYHAENVRIDPFGMAVYSKFPIKELDTILYQEIPSLEILVEIDEDHYTRIINTMLLPSINSSMDTKQKGQLEYTGDYLQSKEGTELVIGDFNMVYWSPRIKDFRSKTDLKNSRRDVSQSVLSIPYDHIFHSPDLECTKFEDLVDSTGTRLGILANFQFFDHKGSEL